LFEILSNINGWKIKIEISDGYILEIN